MIYRLCLIDKSSILIESDNSLEELQDILETKKTIKVKNYNSQKDEIIKITHIWAIRISSENKN